MSPTDQLPPPPGRSRLAVAALIASLLVCVPGAGLLALLLGALAWRRIERDGLRGRRLVALAVALGAIASVGWAVGLWRLGAELTDLVARVERLAIVEVDLQTGARRVVVDDPGPEACPTWAGDRVVYQRGSGTRDLWWVPREGGSARRLTDLPGDATLPAGSPDGREVAFRYRAPDGGLSLGVVAADGGAPRFLFGGLVEAGGPRFSPDGRLLVVAARRAGGAARRLWIVPLDGSAPMPAGVPESGPLGLVDDSDPDWQDSRLAWVRGGRVVAHDLDSAVSTWLYGPVRARAVRLRGPRVYFASNLDASGRAEGSQARRVVRGDLEGTAVRVLLDAGRSLPCLEVSPDERHLLLALPRGSR